MSASHVTNALAAGRVEIVRTGSEGPKKMQPGKSRGHLSKGSDTPKGEDRVEATKKRQAVRANPHGASSINPSNSFVVIMGR
jgi:hypothetical protein